MNEPIFSDDVIIFVATPTYNRTTQKADLIRLAQTLRLVPNIFWIVVEDSKVKSKFIENLLHRTAIPHAHLLGPQPEDFEFYSRGVSNRLKAFEWIRANYRNSAQKGVIYLADDDNSYDIRLFDEIRDTKVVSMLPVGGIAKYGLSSPIVNLKTNQIIGFHDAWGKERTFSVDMAGFAVNLQYFLAQKNASMTYQIGRLEDSFLKSLNVQMWQLEPKASGCSEILVWHTRTEKIDPLNRENMKLVPNIKSTNIPNLYSKNMEQYK